MPKHGLDGVHGILLEMDAEARGYKYLLKTSVSTSTCIEQFSHMLVALGEDGGEREGDGTVRRLDRMLCSNNSCSVTAMLEDLKLDNRWSPEEPKAN